MRDCDGHGDGGGRKGRGCYLVLDTGYWILDTEREEAREAEGGIPEMACHTC